MSLLALAAIVAIDGETTCPTPMQVSEHLEALLADRSTATVPDRARLAWTGEVLELELDSAAGRTLARREFSRQASCAQLAAAVAVVIATWETTLDGVAPRISVGSHMRAAQPSSLWLAVGAGAVTVLDRGGWTPGATAGLALGSTHSRWAGVLDAVLTGSNNVSLAPGSASWARQRFAIGARVEVAANGPFVLDATAQLVTGLLVASGTGFSTDRTQTNLDPGAALGLRAGFAWGAWGLSFAASETAWLRANHLEVTGLSQVDAPRHDLVMSICLAWQLAKP
jgi:hypothetical protein